MLFFKNSLNSDVCTCVKDVSYSNTVLLNLDKGSIQTIIFLAYLMENTSKSNVLVGVRNFYLTVVF